MQSIIRRALISVSDKTYISSFARWLSQQGVEILSTGGTAKLLTEEGIPCKQVSDYTEFPEILDGRVKTLHPKIFAGILARGKQDADVLKHHKMDVIDLVIVNLYPFSQVISGQHTFEEAIENIDIGGVSLIRAAAKNFHHCLIAIEPKDYQSIQEELSLHKMHASPTLRKKLAQKAFSHVAQYDALIAHYLLHHSQEKSDATEEKQELDLPSVLQIKAPQFQTLRYGENPHQRAAIYGTGIQPLQGKPISYTNLLDAQAAWNALQLFPDKAACVIVKHANPCGIGEADTLLTAYNKAFKTDPVSAFGGIIALNQKLDEETAKHIISQQFLEVLIAPEFEKGALEAFQDKPNVRLLLGSAFSRDHSFEFRSMGNNILLQEPDCYTIDTSKFKCITDLQPTEQQYQDLMFAWKCIRFLKSNAIVLVKNHQVIAFGGGQTSRVDAVKLAFLKAQDRNLSYKNAVLASDGFIPFADSIELAKVHEISAIIQPGGSIRDAEVIDACNKASIAMLFTQQRHFFH